MGEKIDRIVGWREVVRDGGTGREEKEEEEKKH